MWCNFSTVEDLKKLRGNKDIGEGIDRAIAGIAEANDLENVIDRAYFNDSEKFGRGAKMVTTLTALINIFSREELNFSRNRADGDDILGDAYEYLMRNFATESGKSKGQFYTPAEVSRVVAAVAGVSRATSPKQTVYDPTRGSGSLLLKAADAADVALTIYGQEFDITTRGLAKMNMIMHGREAERPVFMIDASRGSSRTATRTACVSGTSTRSPTPTPGRPRLTATPASSPMPRSRATTST
ncbi:type I restriction enzyme M protein [Rhodovulum sulfidophilum]|uniref:N-6 DNA methylase n=1 Tax=Rhodovulum sulfidophilum TaxID=35806 RepID=UPI0006966DCD|nr:N-6 DNA methylase [Rhodovulum sulfidophilum]ANB33903.1 hypothetical protein A6W98_07350 [Rhodovulum sulfidophilum DSM 1374]ANB37725.1 hypothetical protein A6024_07205 [Rhodovulum sulfidophilum]MCW2305609.1 type I restriction enzyme M protein [Rhodovulum sulfidophilum]